MTNQLLENKHLGSALRRQLESKHPIGTALRRILALLTDAQVIEVYLDNEAQGRADIARLRAIIISKGGKL